MLDRRLQPMRARRWLAASIVLPWTWFALRDLGNGLDAVAVALPLVVASGVAASILLAVRRDPRLAAGGVSLTLMGAVSVAGPWYPRPGLPPAGPIRLVHANVSEGNRRLEGALADMLAQPADVMVVTEATQRALHRLADAFPSRVVTGDQLILSRYPLQLLTRPEGLRWDGERIEVAAPGRRFVLYPIHMPRPHLHDLSRLREALRGQRNDIGALLAATRREQLPVVVVGDFNISDRTHSYRRLARRMNDAMRTGASGPTYVRPLYRLLWLRIDHVFQSRGWCGRDARRFTVIGSDHRGVAVTVGPCPQRRHQE